MSSTLFFAAVEKMFCCRVAAFSGLRASAAQIAQWRRQPLTIAGQTFPPSFLKHSEEQTVVALRTMLQMIEEQGWQSESFAEWGVIAAPTFLGRVSTAQTFERFQQESAWGVSPHLIPHQSLHGLSGTISQAMKMHGPNFGIGGGPDSSAEAFLLAAALLADGQLPGLWLVLTGHEEEVLPSSEGCATVFPLCHALVLALTTTDQSSDGLHLVIGQAGEDDNALSPCHPVTMSLCGLVGKWRLSNAHWIQFADGNEVLK